MQRTMTFDGAYGHDVYIAMHAFGMLMYLLYIQLLLGSFGPCLFLPVVT